MRYSYSYRNATLKVRTKTQRAVLVKCTLSVMEWHPATAKKKVQNLLYFFICLYYIMLMLFHLLLLFSFFFTAFAF